MPREVKWLAQVHMTSKWQSQDSNPDYSLNCYATAAPITITDYSSNYNDINHHGHSILIIISLVVRETQHCIIWRERISCAPDTGARVFPRIHLISPGGRLRQGPYLRSIANYQPCLEPQSPWAAVLGATKPLGSLGPSHLPMKQKRSCIIFSSLLLQCTRQPPSQDS